jgi:hypothetical protein
MYKQITEKNRSYVVKSIINTSDALLPDNDDSNSLPESTTYSCKTKATTSENTLQEYNKKANAVHEYKNAIFNIGSKIVNEKNTKETRRNNKNSKIPIVTEEEYQVTEDWLIEDLDKKRFKNKRKHKNDNLINIEESEESIEDDNTQSSIIIKENNNRINENFSPIPKKRLISYDSPNSKSNDASSKTSEFSSLMKGLLNSDSNDSTNMDTNSTILPKNQSKMNSLELIDRFLMKSNLNPLTEEIKENEEDLADIFTSSDVTINNDEPMIIHSTSPSTVADKVNKQQKSSSIKYKKQLKINKMDSFNLKIKHQNNERKSNDSDTVKFDDYNNDCLSERSPSVISFKTISESTSTSNSNSWKIKANIENRNFLIPIRCVIFILIKRKC